MWESLGREKRTIFLSLIILILVLTIRMFSGEIPLIAKVFLEIFSWGCTARGVLGMYRVEIIKDRKFRIVDKVVYLLLAMMIINGGFDRIDMFVHPWIIVGGILVFYFFMSIAKRSKVFFHVNLFFSKVYFKYILKGNVRREMRKIMESRTGKKLLIIGVPSYYALSGIHRFCKEENERVYMVVSPKERTDVYKEYMNVYPQVKEYVEIVQRDTQGKVPFEDGTVDAVMTLFSWDFLKIKDEALDIKRVLRIGGRFSIIESGMLYYLISMTAEMGEKSFRDIEILRREYYSVLTGRK